MEDPAPAAMAFMHPDGLVDSLANAAAFAGTDGRVATLPDIIDARTAAPQGGIVWDNWFTTLTGEYYGLSPLGVPVVAVAHGIGPLSGKAGILKAYAHQYKDKTRSRHGGRIPMEEFHRLLDGAYGPVDVVDIRDVLGEEEYPFGAKTGPQLLSNPLWVARLGGRDRAGAYVAVHEAMALESRRRETRSIHVEGEVVAGTILEMAQPGDSPYAVPDWPRRSGAASYLRVTEFPHGAIAHLLSTGRLFNVHRPHDRLTQLECSVDTQDWTDGAQFVGIRGKGTMRTLLPTFRLEDAMKRHLDLLWAPAEGEPDSVSGFGPLTRVGTSWYTEYPKTGAAMDTGRPMHPVVSYEKVGEPRVMTTGGSFFLKYALSEARRLAPEGANAYHLAGEAFRSGEAEISVPLQFARVTVDRSRRVMTEREIHADTALLARIAGG